jgi:hypothetical protein
LIFFAHFVVATLVNEAVGNEAAADNAVAVEGDSVVVVVAVHANKNAIVAMPATRHGFYFPPFPV